MYLIKDLCDCLSALYLGDAEDTQSISSSPSPQRCPSLTFSDSTLSEGEAPLTPPAMKRAGTTIANFERLAKIRKTSAKRKRFAGFLRAGRYPHGWSREEKRGRLSRAADDIQSTDTTTVRNLNSPENSDTESVSQTAESYDFGLYLASVKQYGGVEASMCAYTQCSASEDSPMEEEVDLVSAQSSITWASSHDSTSEDSPMEVEVGFAPAPSSTIQHSAIDSAVGIHYQNGYSNDHSNQAVENWGGANLNAHREGNGAAYCPNHGTAYMPVSQQWQNIFDHGEDEIPVALPEDNVEMTGDDLEDFRLDAHDMSSARLSAHDIDTDMTDHMDMPGSQGVEMDTDDVYDAEQADDADDNGEEEEYSKEEEEDKVIRPDDWDWDVVEVDNIRVGVADARFANARVHINGFADARIAEAEYVNSNDSTPRGKVSEVVSKDASLVDARAPTKEFAEAGVTSATETPEADDLEDYVSDAADNEAEVHQVDDGFDFGDLDDSAADGVANADTDNEADADDEADIAGDADADAHADRDGHVDEDGDADDEADDEADGEARGDESDRDDNSKDNDTESSDRVEVPELSQQPEMAYLPPRPTINLEVDDFLDTIDIEGQVRSSEEVSGQQPSQDSGEASGQQSNQDPDIADIGQLFVEIQVSGSAENP